MESAIPMHFRPTIIIFADEGASMGAAVARDRNGNTVKSTYDHFCDLCAGLDPALWPGIGLLRAYAGDTAEVLPLATTLAGGGVGYLPPEAPQGPGDLAALFRFALASVQHEGVYQDIAYADHEAPSPLAQIFIVGSAASDLPSRVADIINHGIDFYQFKPTVSFVLVNVPYYHSDPANFTRPHPDWVADLVPQNGELPPVNFCYMFEEVTDRGTFIDANTVHYVVAEALFGFVGTASLNAEIFRHTQETHTRVPNPDARIGSVAPALIRFPRTAATDYCAARLGADVLREWASEIHVRELPQTEAQDLRVRAQQSADDLTELLRDRVRRPGTERQGGTHLWPDLTPLKA
ncbi:MAG: hypothetical protein H0X24_18020, partial [Ktedonobacterales bacterium]|nr:hypothetical protein [Ktedonobacterales bacterium]